jgi:hypothetical protein
MWSTDELAALGKVVMNFTALEACADRLLAGFIGQSSVAEILVAGESMTWKLEKLDVLAAEYLESTEAKMAILDWTRAAKLLNDRRNQMIHSWFFDEGKVGSLTRMKASTRGGKWKGQSEPFQLEQVQELAGLLMQGIEAAHPLARALRETGQWQGDLVVINSAPGST